MGAEGGKTVLRVEKEGLKPPVKNVFFPSWEAEGGRGALAWAGGWH